MVSDERPLIMYINLQFWLSIERLILKSYYVLLILPKMHCGLITKLENQLTTEIINFMLQLRMNINVPACRTVSVKKLIIRELRYLDHAYCLRLIRKRKNAASTF